MMQATNNYGPKTIVLQGMRKPISNKLKSGNVTLLYSEPNNEKHENGIGFIIKDSLLNLVKKFQKVNDRLCCLTLISIIFDIVLINYYVPTETADGKLKSTFYEILGRTLNSIPRLWIKIVIRDMNAQKRIFNVCKWIFKKMTDKENVHLKFNNNVLKFVSFAASKYFIISSTMFQRKEIFKHKWISSDRKTKS